MGANPCAKRVTPETAYEVWQSYDGEWTYYVLKKYQSSEREAKNIYAKWYCFVTSPACPKGEYGDSYVFTVKDGTQLIANPLTHYDEQTTGGNVRTLDYTYSVLAISKLALLWLGLSQEQVDSLTEEDMQAIADKLQEVYYSDFCVNVVFFTRLTLAEKQQNNTTPGG